MTDTELFDAIVSNSWDLRCISVPTGGDDYDIHWIVIEHHEAEPCEREIGRAYYDDPREAIRAALRNQNRHSDCNDQCQFALEIGMLQHECANECQYKKHGR